MKVDTMTFDEFLNSRAEWDSALQRSKDNHVFLSWEWLSTWWKHYGDKRKFLLILVKEGERILTAAPLMSSGYKLYGLELRRIEFIASRVSDYHTFLLTDEKPKYVEMMLRYATHLEAEWDCIELQEIPHDSESTRILRTLSREPFKLEENVMILCPRILLHGRFEDYFRGLRGHFRKNQNRYERKLKKDYKVEFKICNDIETLDNNMKTFFDLHQKRWQSQKEPGAFSDQRFQNFHLDVERAFNQRGWLVLAFLLLDDEPVAAIYGFKYAQKLYHYLSGWNPQYSEYSVGNIAHRYLIQYCIENGIKEYDWMRGDEPYKMRWSTSVKRNLEFRAVNRGIVPTVYNWVRKNDTLTSELGKLLNLR